MIKPHHYPCLIMVLAFGLSIGLAYLGQHEWKWVAWAVGLLYGLIAYVRYEEKPKCG